MAKLTKIFGPPGTGKTYRLLQRVRAYVRTGTPYHQIGYFAFTKKASGVARDRVEYRKTSSILPNYPCVLFSSLSMNEEQIMQPYNYEEIGKLLEFA